MSIKALKLTPEEIAIIGMMRGNIFQEIIIQVQDSVTVSVNRILKYRRKKGGGFVFGSSNKINLRPPLKLLPDEILLITKLRSQPFQQIAVEIVGGELKSINQTLKFRKK